MSEHVGGVWLPQLQLTLLDSRPPHMPIWKRGAMEARCLQASLALGRWHFEVRHQVGEHEVHRYRALVFYIAELERYYTVVFRQYPHDALPTEARLQRSMDGALAHARYAILRDEAEDARPGGRRRVLPHSLRC